MRAMAVKFACLQVLERTRLERKRRQQQKLEQKSAIEIQVFFQTKGGRQAVKALNTLLVCLLYLTICTVTGFLARQAWSQTPQGSYAACLATQVLHGRRHGSEVCFLQADHHSIIADFNTC